MTLRPIVLLALLTVGAQGAEPAQTQAPRYALDELIFLNGVGGFGDVGRVETSRELVSPASSFGFSMRVLWEDHPGDPPWWSLRLGLPQSPTGCDRLQFDLYVESSDNQAGLNVFLYEADEDRWIAWQAALATLEPRRWHHVDVPRDQMRMWLLGNQKPEWERIRGLALESAHGKATFCVDAVRLVGSSPHQTLELFSTADDGLHPRPDWPAATVAPVPPPGTVYFPFDGDRLGFEELRDSPVALNRLLGGVGTPVSGYSPELPVTSRFLGEHGVPLLHYGTFGEGYMRYLTRRQAWDVNALGRSLNHLPVSMTTWDGRHSISLAHPAVTEALNQKAEALLRAGLGVWMVVDYTFPWWETLWGYSDAMLAAYRDDLVGRDEGLHLRDGDRRQVVHLAEYFQAYNGFTPEPAQFGLGEWSAFRPPTRGDGDTFERRRLLLFLYLRSYEWLKLADRVGRHYQDRGAHGLWVVPNPEDSYGSSDYLFMVRSCGVRNLFPEWFGAIGWAAEAGYASLPYLREQADRGGGRLSIIQETGAGGHSVPYLDWRLSYNGVYALTAAAQFDDFDNDFIDEQPYARMSDPAADAYQFRRFRDAVAKALAFRQARAEKPIRPAAPILCVSERPPAHACGSIFFGLNQAHTLAAGLSRAHLPFDLRDSLELERVLDRYRVVAYSPWAPQPGHLAALRRWLEAKPGRVLVIHSFVPTRETTEFWALDTSAGLGGVNGGELLGLGRITATEARPTVVAESAPEAAGWVPTGMRLDLGAPLLACATGEPLVRADTGVLVSRARIGAGQVIYLHYPVAASDAVQRLDALLLRGIARQAGVAAFCEADFEALVQVFAVDGGQAVVAWDAPTMGQWSWRYEPGIAPLLFEAPPVNRPLQLPLADAAEARLYDFWANDLQSVPVTDGRVALRLRGALSGLYYMGRDTQAFRQTLASAQALRQRLRDLRFEEIGM